MIVTTHFRPIGYIRETLKRQDSGADPASCSIYAAPPSNNVPPTGETRSDIWASEEAPIVFAMFNTAVPSPLGRSLGIHGKWRGGKRRFQVKLGKNQLIHPRFSGTGGFVELAHLCQPTLLRSFPERLKPLGHGRSLASG
jgi:hypothetical protein